MKYWRQPGFWGVLVLTIAFAILLLTVEGLRRGYVFYFIIFWILYGLYGAARIYAMSKRGDKPTPPEDHT